MKIRFGLLEDLFAFFKNLSASSATSFRSISMSILPSVFAFDRARDNQTGDCQRSQKEQNSSVASVKSVLV